MVTTTPASELATFGQRVFRTSTPPTHTQPYNYDWLWILFVVLAVLLIAALVYFRVFLARTKHPHPQQDPTAAPQDSE